MKLAEYIAKIGDQAAARRFKVKLRTAASWRRGERLPSPDNARHIVACSPVTYKGIYD